MGLNRNINDDSTLAYLFNKTRQGASDALGKAVEKINDALTAINNTIASIQTALNNKVNKSGDTMSGTLTISNVRPHVMIKNTGADTTRATDTENREGNLYFYDKNDKLMGFVQTLFSTSGQQRLYLAARRQVNGANAQNLLTLAVNADGTESVGVSSPTAWRAALGLGSIATVNSPVPIANGGTGLTASPSMLTNLGSTTADTILEASPRPGVTGTLPIANGGTGATTAAAALTNLGAASYTAGTWIPKLYDNNTYKSDLPSQHYYKIGSLCVMFVELSSFPNTTFSTMIQIRNCPCSSVVSGAVYIAAASGQGGTWTIQGSGSYAYLRPNFAGTINGGYCRMMFIGYD